MTRANVGAGYQTTRAQHLLNNVGPQRNQIPGACEGLTRIAHAAAVDASRVLEGVKSIKRLGAAT